MLLHVATVPLPQPTMEAGVVEHHSRAVRVSAPRLRWQGALSQRAGNPVQVDR
ncbi:arsenite efflux pump ArsB [Cupriavidus yeoncheonensis]|uniref:arsenite efflux pump ArsB n=1 Tax=Cupriavidus yeoncheonensis TaxID=1462994 RepID=UPI001E33B7D6|nr:arsenite efflux pump ArsB [Cupriavidus yeoncheonensis]